MTRPGEPDPGSANPNGNRQERREIFYWGHVQGVGFRYTTRSIAASLPVVGWVRNLPDGRVQLVAEGSTEAIDELLQRLDAEMDRYIQGKDVTVGRATGEFSSFEVAR
jgi:acylphosphatase